MNRIDKKFKELKKTGKKAFIAYITAGDPDMETTGQLVTELEKSGVDIIELGVPFSDPMADGPVNQRAAERSLARGTTLPEIISLVKTIREKTRVPILFFTYANPVYQYGIEQFARDASSAGVDGILVVDLPPEEAAVYRKTLQQYGINMIYLIAPTSGEKRIRMISAQAKGFIYVVSRTGVTGAKKDIPEDIASLVQTIHRWTDLPVAVGFGISNRDQVSAIFQIADGAVVGSAIVEQIEKNIGKPDLVTRVSRYVSDLIPT